MFHDYFTAIVELTIPMSIAIMLLFIIKPFIKKTYTAKWHYYIWIMLAIRLIPPFHWVSIIKRRTCHYSYGCHYTILG